MPECNFRETCAKYKRNECNPDDIFCIRKFKITQLQELALLTEWQRVKIPLWLDDDSSDLDVFNRLAEIEHDIAAYVAGGHNLYLYSATPGNGKTRWALRLLNAFFEKIWYTSELTSRGLFINIPRFLLALKDNISQKNDYVQHIKDNILNADIVVWDELGSKNLTTFENENVLSMINSRIEDGKTNIYTSNLGAADLQIAVGERLFSRVFNLSERLEFKGRDKRGITLPLHE